MSRPTIGPMFGPAHVAAARKWLEDEMSRIWPLGLPDFDRKQPQDQRSDFEALSLAAYDQKESRDKPRR